MGAANKASKGGKVNDDRRRLILNTAAKLLRQHGPSNTTMADIARGRHRGRHRLPSTAAPPAR